MVYWRKTPIASYITLRKIWRGRDSWDGWDELSGLREIVKPPGLKGDTGAPGGTKGDGAGGVVYVCRGFDSFPHK